MKRSLYPFLLSMVLTLFLFSQNRYELEWYDLIRPLLSCFGFSVVAYGASRLWSKNENAAGIMTFVMVLAVFAFSFNHVLISMFHPYVRMRYALPAWVLLFGGTWFYMGLRANRIQFFRNSTGMAQLNFSLNLFSIILIILQCFPLISYATRKYDDVTTVQANEKWADDIYRQIQAANPNGVELPDIYFLILDAYARGDVLKEKFGYDNEPFYSELRSLGFQVAEHSNVQYPWTHLSVPSTLNMDYLQNFLPADFLSNKPKPTVAGDQFIVSRMSREYVDRSRTMLLMKKLGYAVERNDSGYAITRIHNRPSGFISTHMTKLEELTIRKTVIGELIYGMPVLRYYLLSNDKWIQTLDEFAKIADNKASTFAFYHIISPHSPFTFDEHGRSLYDELLNSTDLKAYKEHYKSGYIQNVKGLNLHVIASIKDLLKRSDGNAIVIIQSDHGSRLDWEAYKMPQTDVHERFSNLNAIYIPSRYSKDGFDDNNSSVNTFRMLFNDIFNLKLPKLENHAWFDRGAMNFVEVTDQVNSKSFVNPREITASSK